MKEELRENLAIHLDKKDKVDIYEKNIMKIEENKMPWSWWAVFFNFWFFLYRKLYIEAAIYFFGGAVIQILFTGIIFGLGLIHPIGIIIGTVGMIIALLWFYLYAGVLGFKAYKAKLEKDIIIANGNKKILKELGGKNEWVVYICIGLMIVGLMIAGFAIAAGMSNHNVFYT